MTWFAQLEHVIVAVVVIVVLNAFSKYGLKGGLFTLFMGLPGVEWVARKLIQREMAGMVKKISNKTKSKDDQGEREKRVKSRCFLPEKGTILNSDIRILMMAVWSKALSLTVNCLSLLLEFESRPGYVRKFQVTWS